MLSTSLSVLSTSNRKRAEKIRALAHVLEFGTEEDYLELLIGWGIPATNLESLLNEFRHFRQERRKLLL